MYLNFICASVLGFCCISLEGDQLPLLPEFLLFASAVLSQLAQLSSLSPAKWPICKDRGREERGRETKKRKGEENQWMGMRRKGGKERDCSDNVDCQELLSW